MASTSVTLDALTETIARAIGKYPEQKGRIERAAQLLATGHVDHLIADLWMVKKPLDVGDKRLSWYFGPGGDIGIPLDDQEDFFLAVRAPLGVQFMVSPKVETFGEFAPGVQLADQTDFYWAASVGVRFVLGGK